jgi:hypothetical protein
MQTHTETIVKQPNHKFTTTITEFGKMKEYHTDGTIPSGKEIFVFGSNLSGIHGAGAARAAMDFYGAEWGVGIGRTGESYAIPTKSEGITRTLSLLEILPFVEDFVSYTQKNPDLKFWVTRVGCGLAGHYDGDIAPMFFGAINCSFPEEWKEYLEVH